ncbi:HAD family hydrolase [Limibacter armeniacum]|uniref:HAD family hydrolase n=1 Tax=Limibacter armeniacum TaxID=466084 RepID=UPI002FE65FCA
MDYMKTALKSWTASLLICLLLCCCSTSTNTDQQAQQQENTPTAQQDPLPSWNENNTKHAIITYVEEITDKNSGNFIPELDRIATFDNDGTLWSEQPIYFQLFFAMDRVKAMADEHPDWKNKQPFKAVLDNNRQELMKQGEKGILEIVMNTHAGMTTEEFEKEVKNWVATAEHPIKKKRYTELVYQPMLELLQYLRANGFKTFIVSGGGVDFMRPWVEEVYGIPRDQVVGSTIQVKYDYNNGKPVVRKLAEIDYIDDKDGKPECIHKYIGRKPVFAAGNSDGDLQMLRWADANPYKSFQLYVHHTDSTREWAYDRQSHIGQFDKGLDEAKEKNWTLVDMKNDWKVVYPFDK